MQKKKTLSLVIAFIFLSLFLTCCLPERTEENETITFQSNENNINKDSGDWLYLHMSRGCGESAREFWPKVDRKIQNLRQQGYEVNPKFVFSRGFLHSVIIAYRKK